MNLVLNLSPETESRLKEQAAREGKDPETFALEALEARLSPSDLGPNKMPLDQWIAKLRSLPQTLPAGNPHAEFDRDEIYQGRGE
jgi:hypothetical protein